MSAAEDCPKFGSLLKVLKAKVAEMEQTCNDEHDHSEPDEAPAVESAPEESDPAPAAE